MWAWSDINWDFYMMFRRRRKEKPKTNNFPFYIVCWCNPTLKMLKLSYPRCSGRAKKYDSTKSWWIFQIFSCVVTISFFNIFPCNTGSKNIYRIIHCRVIWNKFNLVIFLSMIASPLNLMGLVPSCPRESLKISWVIKKIHWVENKRIRANYL